MAALEIPTDLPLFDQARGKVVVLTGGSTGIGQATVRRLVSHGALVSFLDLDVENGEKLATELGYVSLSGACPFERLTVQTFAQR